MSVDVGSRMGRRVELRRRRRQQRRRLALAGLAVLLVLTLVVTGLLVTRGGRVGRRSTAVTRTQQTLLLQVRATDGTAISSALLAHDPKGGDGSVVLLPPQVLTSIPGLGTVPLGRALQTGSAASSRNGISDLLGVTIDAGWLLDADAFAALVNREGGIRVAVDTTVPVAGTILLQPGDQRLDGRRALLYATYLAPGEQEQARLARLQQVLEGILASLPTDAGALLGSLGSSSVTTAGAARTGAVLTGLRADDKASNLQYRSLPVIKIDSGGDETTFRLDPTAARALVDELLAASVPAGARSTRNRVLVLNGVGTPGLGDQVRGRLVAEGFVFVGSRNAEHLGYQQTQVLVPDGTASSIALGARVAAALGLPDGSVRTSTALGSVSDVVVLVGRDFRP